MRASLMCLVLWTMAPVDTHRGRDTWTAFLERRTDDGHGAVVEMVERCRETACEREVAPDSAQVARLVALVNRGDPRAIDLAFLCRRLLDGGDLEDLSRSLGAVADVDPRLFLEQVRRHRLPPSQARAIVRMMPLETVDDEAGSRSAARRRVKSLATVTDVDLREGRDDAIAAVMPLVTTGTDGR